MFEPRMERSARKCCPPDMPWPHNSGSHGSCVNLHKMKPTVSISRHSNRQGSVEERWGVLEVPGGNGRCRLSDVLFLCKKMSEINTKKPRKQSHFRVSV